MVVKDEGGHILLTGQKGEVLKPDNGYRGQYDTHRKGYWESELITRSSLGQGW